ncbi:reactive mitochondrial oxygen species modulator 1-domain-containing protein [Fimicolochytrium jonesii]|uniref:reactive mitochondrial oxygen species modulator 1-domain-containing protein n=1 Tax=Fimicolochytrium jonesii TaxID=1396493 RepID=UPI0022FE9002|nr:reactive mitochondrial oxygen species modulator 1-domain-containing protein [Fimicolochytrium jonesii]KAI8822955.1 reactive mitochondrial oxygen species modulator 1-domain-containing protein [Fimicolochytrium jonesii]
MQRAEGPTWFDKWKMGFIMGGSAGMCVGFLYGTMTVLRVGPDPGRGYMSTVGKYMLQHGAMLGFFLSIGAFLRNEERKALEYPYPTSYTPWGIRQSRLPIVIERQPVLTFRREAGLA